MDTKTRPPFVKKYVAILHALCYLNKDQRTALLSKATLGLVKCICEYALNILNGNIPLKDTEKKKLKRFAENLRKLSEKSRTWNNKKSFIIRKQGEFLPQLLSPVLAKVYGKSI